MSKASLAQRAAAGEREAFAAIYERHHQGLYRYCRSLLGNAEEASDALHNTMVRVLGALPGERREIALKPWLYRIAHNESMRLLSGRRPQVALDEAPTHTSPGPDAVYADREKVRQLFTDLQDLPERQRGALVMRELSGLGYGEIAAAFGISLGAAKQTVCEARTSLHEFAEGREMECAAVRPLISARDGRLVRGRKLRSHLRHCKDCQEFRSAIQTRPTNLGAVAPPLHAAAAAELLQSFLGGGGQSGGAGLVGLLGGGAGQGAGAAVAAKGIAAVAAVMAIGVGTAGFASTEGAGEGPEAGAQSAERPARPQLPRREGEANSLDQARRKDGREARGERRGADRGHRTAGTKRTARPKRTASPARRRTTVTGSRAADSSRSPDRGAVPEPSQAARSRAGAPRPGDTLSRAYRSERGRRQAQGRIPSRSPSLGRAQREIGGERGNRSGELDGRLGESLRSAAPISRNRRGTSEIGPDRGLRPGLGQRGSRLNERANPPRGGGAKPGAFETEGRPVAEGGKQ